jgi:hypothetical protein
MKNVATSRKNKDDKRGFIFTPFVSYQTERMAKSKNRRNSGYSLGKRRQGYRNCGTLEGMLFM